MPPFMRSLHVLTILNSRQLIDMVLDFYLDDAPEREIDGYTGYDEMAASPWWMIKVGLGSW